jgi:hypothetical protein
VEESRCPSFAVDDESDVADEASRLCGDDAD